MPKNLWTKEEIDVLIKAEDKNNISLPNRSSKSIHRKLVRLKLIKPAFKLSQKFSKKAWTKEEINLLKSSKDPRNVKIPGRSRNSICGMAVRLGLADKKPARRPWSKKNEKILLELTKQGKTPIEIVRMNVLPYSRTSIQNSDHIMVDASPKSSVDKDDYKLFLLVPKDFAKKLIVLSTFED